MNERKRFAMTMDSWPADRPARLFTLHNRGGMQVAISEYGAALVSWWAPDRYGRTANVLLGHADESEYARHQSCLGAVVERDGGLHAGMPRLHATRWRGDLEAGGAAVRLRPSDVRGSSAGWDGIEVRYRLDDDGSLSIDCQSTADTHTLMNLSTHACFNLNGGLADVSDHMLQIHADRYFEIGSGGAWRDAAVSGTPFDFRRPAAIGPRLCWPHAQIGVAGGFDHCYRVACGAASGIVRPVATVHDPGSGRRLQVSTNEPGLRFYSGNRLGGVQGRGYGPYVRHAGFCLEADTFGAQDERFRLAGEMPDPGETYCRTTVYQLSLLP
jgi:aldose 1-epimerase